MIEFKFEVGDFVVLKAYPEDGAIQIRARSVGFDNLWYDVGGVPYREDQLEFAGRSNTEIKIIYRIDGLDFDTLDEAQKHEKKIKLFNKLSEGLSDEDKDALLFFIDTLVDNAAALKEIL